MKFSIVTPVYNGEKYIAETIESILTQKGDFEIEYIIQDGASTDRTIEIVKSYEERLRTGQYSIQCKKVVLTYLSQKDAGMYDAVEKGFAKATGEIFAYLNADDMYLPGAFAAVEKIFSTFPEIEWVKGINTTSDERGTSTSQGSCFLYRQDWLQKGVYGRSAYFVQQDSVFWKRTLWEKAKPDISWLRLAGDYALWTRFAQYAPLWSFNRQVSVFRKRPGQLSADMQAYHHEQRLVLPPKFFLEKRVLLFFVLKRMMHLVDKSIAAKILLRLLFPFHKRGWYIDFDANGVPVKKHATSYLV